MRAIVEAFMKERPPAAQTRIFGSPLVEDEPSAQPPIELPAAPVQAVDHGQIARYIQEALGKFGAPGNVSIEEKFAVLTYEREIARVEVGAWMRQWPSFDEGTRRTLVIEVAGRLSGARSQPLGRLKGPGLLIDLSIALPLFALVLFGGYFIITRFWTATEESKIGLDSNENVVRAGTKSEPMDRDSRASASCKSTQARVFQGGSVSVADVDGWLVEIMLMKAGTSKPLGSHPALKRFFSEPGNAQGSLFTWEDEPGLASIMTSDTLTHLRQEVLFSPSGQSISVLTIAFAGMLVDPYFQTNGRRRYYHIAQGLSDALQATHVGVYARCFDDDIHALGGWFQGPDSGGAATALLYIMGIYARPLHIASPFYRAPGSKGLDRLRAFESIQEHTQNFDRAALATVVGSEGGMATGKTGGPVTITFPFTDGNRASRVSRSMARVANLAAGAR